MRSASLTAFVDELEKIAAGPRVIYDPEMRTGAQYWPPSFVDRVEAARPDIGVKAMVGKKHGALVGPHPSQFSHHPEGAQAYKALRRHEMTHWMRDRRGLFGGVGKPGLRNVLRTAREEGAAYLSQRKALRNAPQIRRQSLVRLPKDFLTSMRAAYPAGVGKAVMGGTLGKVVRPIAGLAKRFVR